jgi:DNA-binding CsgD family transcriptional regulator/Flp pilus assembly protein TadD
MLRLAAVAGRQFELNVLQNLTGFDDEALTAAVKELIHQRLFEEVSRDRFAFRHALLRQAIYDDLLIRERQDLHLALLHIIEESDSMQSDAHLAELSHHAYQAEAWEAALHYGFRAGQRALSLHSPRAAAEHFTHAVEAASKLGDQASWELYMQRGKAYDSLGEFQQALDDYELALQASGDQTATWQTLIAIALLWSARDYHQAEAYCKRAMDLAQSMQEPKLIGHSLNRLGNWFLNTGQPHEALDYHEQALAVFEELNDLQGKGETLDLLGMTNSQVLRLEASQNYYRDAMTIFRELDDKKMLASSMTNLAANTLDQPLAEEAVDIAHQIGWYSGEAYACIMLGYMISFQGHFSKSLSYLNRGLELAQAIDHIQWLAGAYVFSAFVYRDMLDLTTAAARAEQGSALAAEVGSQWYSDMGNGLLALILIEQGQLEAAEKILAQETVPDSPAMQHMMLAMAEIELTLANGHAELALSQLERIDRIFFSTSASDSSRAMWLVPYLMMRTRTLILLGRPADAADTLSQARHICEDMELLPFLWQVEIMIGQLAEDKAVAEQSFRRARDIINLLADRTPAGLRERFRHKAEKRIASDRGFAAASRSRHDLTAREMDIAREVALGKTNQQIADDLHITIKTVEAHITRALSKLDLTSRTQIALWAVENKIIPPSNVG